jgi:lysozyme family protein
VAKIPLIAELKKKYEGLFTSCKVHPQKLVDVDRIIDRLLLNHNRYQQVADGLGIPWHFVAAIHNMEATLDFTRHLHNGDPLSARTVHVPVGRPKKDKPPFTWEASARDALSLHSLNKQTDWSLSGNLYQLEGYNGWGYRLYHPHVLSPYLWSGSQHYEKGKYTDDGIWSDVEVSNQIGSAVILRRMVEQGMINFAGQPTAAEEIKKLVVRYGTKKSADPLIVAKTELLQRRLNTVPGISIKVDGISGQGTSEAYRKVTGSYLPGDPRL